MLGNVPRFDAGTAMKGCQAGESLYHPDRDSPCNGTGGHRQPCKWPRGHLEIVPSIKLLREIFLQGSSSLLPFLFSLRKYRFTEGGNAVGDGRKRACCFCSGTIWAWMTGAGVERVALVS